MIDKSAALDLLQVGVAVEFRIVETRVLEGPDGGEFTFEIELEFPVNPETEDHDLGWGAFGFMFVIGSLSFADARPRESSTIEFDQNDQFYLGDFMNSLRWEQTDLHLDADYIRGRRLKTHLQLKPDGTGRLRTTGRGKSALHWLGRLKGKQPLQLVSG